MRAVLLLLAALAALLAGLATLEAAGRPERLEPPRAITGVRG